MYTGDYDAAVQEHEETTIKDQDGDLVVDDRESSTVTAAVSIQDGDTVSEFLSFKGKDKKQKRKKKTKVPKNLLRQHRSTCFQPGPPESVFGLMSREMGSDLHRAVQGLWQRVCEVRLKIEMPDHIPGPTPTSPRATVFGQRKGSKQR